MAMTVSKSLPKVAKTLVPEEPGLIQVYQTVAPVAVKPGQRGAVGSSVSVVAPTLSPTAMMPETAGVVTAIAFAKLSLAGAASAGPGAAGSMTKTAASTAAAARSPSRLAASRQQSPPEVAPAIGPQSGARVNTANVSPLWFGGA